MEDFDNLVLDDFSFSDDDLAQHTSTNNPEQEDSTETAPTTKKKMMPVKRLNQQLLCAPEGLPALKHESQYLTFRGKGYEEANLEKLMEYYAVWANSFFPKLKLKDFIRRMKTPASSGEVKKMVQAWQEEYQVKRQALMDPELSGETVGDIDGDRAQAEEEEAQESSEDENRPLFFPITESASAAMENARLAKTRIKKTSSSAREKYMTSDIINSDDEDEEEEEDLQPNPITQKKIRTITFSDDEDEISPFRKKPKLAPSKGREYALALLAEKRKQKEAAKRKAMEEEEEEENNDNLDDYNPDIQLAILDPELEKLQSSATSKDNINLDFSDDEDMLGSLLDISKPSKPFKSNKVVQQEEDFDDEVIEMEDVGDLLLNDEASKDTDMHNV